MKGGGERGAVHRGAVGATCLGDSRVWGSHLSWRRVWEDLRAGGLTFRGPIGVGSETVRIPRFGIALDLGEESASSMEVGVQAGWCPSCCRRNLGLLCVCVCVSVRISETPGQMWEECGVCV